MAEYDLHDVTYSAKTTEDWNAPRESDFDTDDLGGIDDHFLLSSSGFPADDFEDLKLPVVDADGALNLNALQSAHGGAHSVEAIDDVSEDTRESVKDELESLARDEFDHDLG